MGKKDFKKNAAELFISAAEEEPIQQPQTENISIPKGYKLQKESKSARMQLLIRPTTKAAIKKAADEQKISMNDLINQILDKYVEGGQ